MPSGRISSVESVYDGGGYVIQSSYTFLDSENRIVCPTSNNHVLMLRATEEDGSVIPEFEKVLDIDIKAAAEAALGKELTQNLLCLWSLTTMETFGLQRAASVSTPSASSRAFSATLPVRPSMRF